MLGAVIVAICLLSPVMKFHPFSPTDLTVHVTNVGDMEFQSVRVEVTGRSYELGRILPGKEASTVVSPTGESSVKLRAIDLRGDVQNYDTGPYIEPGFVGDIRIKLTYQRLVAVDSSAFP